MNSMETERKGIEAKIADLEKKHQKMVKAVMELSKESTIRETKLREIKEIIESENSDLIESFYRIKIILDN